MKLLIVTVQDGLASAYVGPKAKTKQSELDEEAQFLELKMATNNPSVKENLEFWRKTVAEKNFYGLLVWIDHDKNSIESIPLETSKEYDAFVELMEKMKEKKE